MRGELVSIPTSTVPLDGMFYEPQGVPAGSVLLFHGNMGNFYTGPSRFLPTALVANGFTCLAFNRRGHDILVNQVGRAAHGGAFQLADEGVADNEYAAKFLVARGYDSPVVIGHSNGGTLAGVFAATHPHIAGLVLLSAHAGGADTYRRSCAAGLMAAGEAEQYQARANSMVAEGRGRELILLPSWWYAISAESLLDRIERTPDLLAEAPAVTCPSLAIRGSLESPTTYPMEEFARRAAGPSVARVIEGSDHWYVGYEFDVSHAIAEWLNAPGRT